MKDNNHEVFENLPKKFSVMLLSYENVEPLTLKLREMDLHNTIIKIQVKTAFELMSRF